MQIELLESNNGPISAAPPDMHPDENDMVMLENMLIGLARGETIGTIPLPLVDICGVMQERKENAEFIEALESAFTKLVVHEKIMLNGEKITIQNEGEGKATKQLDVLTLADSIENGDTDFPLAVYIRNDGAVALFDPAMPEIGGVRVNTPPVEVELPPVEITIVSEVALEVGKPNFPLLLR